MFTENFRGFDFVETPKDTPADLDGFIVKEGSLISGVEVKCRNMTVMNLKHVFHMKWLITADKLERCVALCKSLGIDFRGFLYLVPDRLLMIVPIYSYRSGWLVKPEYEHTETQETVNGGTITRLNAYIDVTGAKVVAEL